MWWSMAAGCPPERLNRDPAFGIRDSEEEVSPDPRAPSPENRLRFSADRNDVSCLANGGALAARAVEQHAGHFVLTPWDVGIFNRERLGRAVALECDLAA